MSPSRTALALTAMFLLLAAVQPAYGQAYCALRDPVSAIANLMPEADSHRTHVRVVRKEHQTALRELVNFTVMNAELGEHTLYVVFDDGKQIGFVHTRTEKGRFGLNEYIWALDTNLNILSYRHQRCRDPARYRVDQDEMHALLEGRSASELAAMLDDQGLIRADVMEFDGEDTLRYASSLVRSGVKTILISRLVWTELF